MLNAPEIPQQPQPNQSELEQLRARLARLEERADRLPAEKTERLIRHVDQRFTEVREALQEIKECIPSATVAQLEARLDQLEHEQQRLESKLDELWRDHTRLLNRSE